MPVERQISFFTLALTVGALSLAATAHAQSNQGAQLAQSKPAAQAPAPSAQPPAAAEAPKDPREGDPAYEQAQRLMKAIDSILQDTARQRGEARKLPSDKDFLMKPLWTETKEDREKKIRDLLDSALGIVTDVPVVDVQKKIEGLRKNIRELDDRIVKLREKQIVAPKDGMLPGLIYRHRRQPLQGHRRDQEEDRAQPRGDRQGQGRGPGSAQQGRRAAGARAGRPAARQRAVRRPRPSGGRLQLGQDDRRPARPPDERFGREHRCGAQVFRHARGAVCHAAALAGPADREDRQAVPAQADRHRSRHPCRPC